jgi:hypothetical protein
MIAASRSFGKTYRGDRAVSVLGLAAADEFAGGDHGDSSPVDEEGSKTVLVAIPFKFYEPTGKSGLSLSQQSGQSLFHFDRSRSFGMSAAA